MAPPRRGGSTPTPPSGTGHGGSRAGAGRKRAVFSDEFRERLGAAPSDPLALPGYFARAIALDFQERVEGRGSEKHSDLIRKTAAVVVKLVPFERVHAAKKVITADAEKKKTPEGPATQKVNDGDPRPISGTPPRRG